MAGTGTCAYGGDGGQGLQATLCNPQSTAVDFTGNVYFVDSANFRIRRIAPGGVIGTVAGNGVRGTSGDGGLAVNASIGAVTQLAVDSSLLIFGDPDAHKIRFVLLSSGSIQGLGTGNAVSAGDGSSWNAVSFNQPSGIELFYQTVPPNEVATGIYVADGVDNLVRRLDGITGVASTIVGPGTPGQLGDGGPATAASLMNPAGIRLYNNALYIADSGNNRIRMLDLNTGLISTVAGDGTPAFGGDGGPATAAQIWSPGHITFDALGNMYFTDRGNLRIRMVDTNGIITTFAGNGTNGVGPDNVAPTLSWFGGVNGVAWNALTLGPEIADGSNRIRQVLPFTPSTTSLTASQNPALPGDALTLTVSVAPAAATGHVTFYNGSAVIGTTTLTNAAATFSWAPPGVGTYPLKASYAGDVNYGPSSSALINAVVQLGTTTTSIASSQNPASTGQALTFTATVIPAAATGTMTFIDQYPQAGGTMSAQLGIVPVVNGVATLTTSSLVAASHTIQVWYSGDVRYRSGVPVTYTQVVKNSTSTALTAAPNPSTYGASVSLVAQVTPATATGSVQFFNGTTLVGSASVGSGGSAQIMTTTLPVGSSSMTASYLGDGSNSPSASSAVVETIAKANSTMTLSASPAAPSFGQTVTLTAMVSPAGTGTVQFFNGSTLLGTGTIANNQAQITSATLPVGSNSLTAAYSGDGNTNSSTSGIVQLTVTAGSTTTVLSASPSVSSLGQSVTLTATVTSSGATGTVQFLNGGTVLGTAAVSGGQAQISTIALPVGVNSLTATYSGDANYNLSSSASIQETVNKVATTTALTSSPSPSTFGQAVTLMAAVSPSKATGAVQFFNGTTLLGTAILTSGQAQFTTTALAAGTFSLTAVYSGDASNAASTSNGASQTVSKASTSTGITTNPAFPTVGQTVNLVAAVAPTTATGAVNFFSGSTLLGTSTVSNGQATFPITATAAGLTLLNLEAVYQGDSNYNSSFSSTISVNVQKGLTATTVSSSVNPSIQGQSVTFTATVTPVAATGTVTFSGVGNASVANGVASITTSTLPAGTTSVSAQYNGESNYNPSSSGSLAQIVRVASVTSLTTSPEPSTFGQSVNLTATVTPSSATGPVQFFNGGALLATATLSGGHATFSSSTLPGGSDSLTAVYSGDANHAASTSAVRIQTVNRENSTTSLKASPSSSSPAETVTFTATVAPAAATGTVQFLDSSTVLATIPLNGETAQFSTSSLSAGTHSIKAVYSGDINVNSSQSSVLNYKVR